MASMSFNAIGENKLLAKISEFTVPHDKNDSGKSLNSPVSIFGNLGMTIFSSVKKVMFFSNIVSVKQLRSRSDLTISVFLLLKILQTFKHEGLSFFLKKFIWKILTKIGKTQPIFGLGVMPIFSSKNSHGN